MFNAHQILRMGSLALCVLLASACQSPPPPRAGSGSRWHQLAHGVWLAPLPVNLAATTQLQYCFPLKAGDRLLVATEAKPAIDFSLGWPDDPAGISVRIVAPRSITEDTALFVAPEARAYCAYWKTGKSPSTLLRYRLRLLAN